MLQKTVWFSGTISYLFKLNVTILKYSIVHWTYKYLIKMCKPCFKNLKWTRYSFFYNFYCFQNSLSWHVNDFFDMWMIFKFWAIFLHLPIIKSETNAGVNMRKLKCHIYLSIMTLINWLCFKFRTFSFLVTWHDSENIWLPALRRWNHYFIVKVIFYNFLQLLYN